jgi:hypothetical protein
LETNPDLNHARRAIPKFIFLFATSPIQLNFINPLPNRHCHSHAMRGLLNGGPVILGYGKHPEKKTTFVVNETEAEQVKEIFRLYLVRPAHLSGHFWGPGFFPPGRERWPNGPIEENSELIRAGSFSPD